MQQPSHHCPHVSVASSLLTRYMKEDFHCYLLLQSVFLPELLQLCPETLGKRIGASLILITSLIFYTTTTQGVFNYLHIMTASTGTPCLR